MTIYQGSRYTNIPVENQFYASSYIGDRYTQLYSSLNVGDSSLKVYDATGMFIGTQIQIIDSATEMLTVSSTTGPYTDQVWNSVLQDFATVTYYTINLLKPALNAHSANVGVRVPKANYRPAMIPTIDPRVGLIESDGKDEVIIWRYKDRLDLYADSRYGDSQLYWSILDANPQYLSEFDIQIGDTVVIPSYQKVLNQMRGGI